MNTMDFSTSWKEPLGEDDHKWNEIVNNTNIESSKKLEEHSRKLMEKRSIRESHISVEICDLWWMVKNSSELVVQKRFVVE